MQSNSNGNIALGVVGGLIGALAGALLYAVIVVSTGYSLGILALLLGAATGGGVKLLGRGAGIAFQMVAVVFTLVSVVAAKYFAIAGILVSKAKEGGVELGYFDDKVMEIFWPAIQATSEMPDVLYEIAWAVGAVFIAWSMLSASDD